MDLSKLSTQDLEALRDNDLSRVSTEGLTYLQQSMQAQQPAAPAAPAAPQRSGLQEIGRQVGLTARSGLKGVGQVLDIGAAPIAYTLNKAFPGNGFETASRSLERFADFVDLPKPQNATERIIGEGTSMLAGGGGTLGLTQQAARLPQVVGKTSEVVGKAFANLSKQPTAQLTASGAAGVAGETAKESGQNPLWQFAASTGGSVAGGALPGLARSGANAVRNALPSTQKEIDLQISGILSKNNVDYAKLPAAIRESMRREVAKALNTGGTLNEDAVRRLADFKRIGATPTVGMLTLDPVQLTREKNLAKEAANSGRADKGYTLPYLENANNKRLTQFSNEVAGGDADLYTAGERTIGVIQARDDAAKTVESNLYKQARDSAGRDIELSRSTFTNSAFENLARSNKGAFLPAEVENLLNMISQGQVTKGGRTFDVPFDINTIDSLKTTLAAASRATNDGNAKAAIKAVRDALENTPIEPVKKGFGDSQVVNGATANFMQEQDSLPQKALDAFDKARAYARARRNWQESNKGVTAALDDAQPDSFMQKYFLGGSVFDASGIAKELRKSPEALEVAKQSVVNYLKSKALGGADDEVGNFRQSGYNSALKAIERKLPLLFSEKEIGDLKALGRAASYMQVQPPGSAVNNSNSGALVLGRAGDAMEAALNLIPFGTGQVLSDLSRAGRIRMSTRSVRDPVRGLLQEEERIPFNRSILPLTIYGGGLLSE